MEYVKNSRNSTVKTQAIQLEKTNSHLTERRERRQTVREKIFNITRHLGRHKVSQGGVATPLSEWLQCESDENTKRGRGRGDPHRLLEGTQDGVDVLENSLAVSLNQRCTYHTPQ